MPIKMGIPEKYRRDPLKSKKIELRLELDVIGEEENPYTGEVGYCVCGKFGPHDHMVLIGHDPEAEEWVTMELHPSLYRL